MYVQMLKAHFVTIFSNSLSLSFSLTHSLSLSLSLSLSHTHSLSLLHSLSLSLSHTFSLSLFLQPGFQIDSDLLNGRNALHYAADYGQADVIKYLVSKGAKLDVSE